MPNVSLFPVVSRDKLVRASELIGEAIRLLDQAGARPDIAAHLDLALHRLRNSSQARN